MQYWSIIVFMSPFLSEVIGKLMIKTAAFTTTYIHYTSITNTYHSTVSFCMHIYEYGDHLVHSWLTELLQGQRHHISSLLPQQTPVKVPLFGVDGWSMIAPYKVNLGVPCQGGVYVDFFPLAHWLVFSSLSVHIVT